MSGLKAAATNLGPKPLAENSPFAAETTVMAGSPSDQGLVHIRTSAPATVNPCSSTTLPDSVGPEVKVEVTSAASSGEAARDGSAKGAGAWARVSPEVTGSSAAPRTAAGSCRLCFLGVASDSWVPELAIHQPPRARISAAVSRNRAEGRLFMVAGCRDRGGTGKAVPRKAPCATLSRTR